MMEIRCRSGCGWWRRPAGCAVWSWRGWGGANRGRAWRPLSGVLAQAHADVDAVDEQVRAAVKAQRARAEPLVLGLPLRAQPADRRRRQAGGVLAEQQRERRLEGTGRQAAQVEHWQHVVARRRAPGA